LELNFEAFLEIGFSSDFPRNWRFSLKFLFDEKKDPAV